MSPATPAYDDVLFPTDGSESAAVAFDHALGIAKRYDATLHVLFVVNTTYRDVGATGRTTIDSLRERGEETLADTAAAARESGVAVETHLAEGDPYREIVDAGSEHADLIVMSTRGRQGVDRYLLGSVTEKVVRTSSVPVFTVRGES